VPLRHRRPGRPVRRAAAALAVIGALAVAAPGCTEDDASPATTAPPTTAPATPSTSTTAPRPTQPAARDFTAVDAATDTFVQEEQLNGAAIVVVDREDGIVHEHYTGEFGPDRVSLIASASKMLTAGVLLRLDDQGLLDVDAPVADAVPWGGGNPEVTPAQLLSNSSGLVGLIDDPTFGPYICQYLAQGTLQGCAEQIFTTTQDDDRVVPPDTEFRYGGGQWQVAGGLAEAVSGRTWAELVDETYIEPCGVDSLAYNNHFAQTDVLGGPEANPFSYPEGFDGDPSVLSPTENPNMEGGAYISPTDYAALLLMQLRGGRCGDTQVLSSAAVERMHTDRIGPAYGGSTDSEDLSGYGLGWWVATEDPAIVEDGGAFGAVPWLDTADGYGVYLVVERTSKDGQRLARQLRPLVDEQMGSG
jgi:CubicO group peptidase (beta-lactamase class C family)